MENAEQEFVSVVREYERVIYKVCYLYGLVGSEMCIRDSDI